MRIRPRLRRNPSPRRNVAARLGRDEEGAVMVLTLVVALLLVKVAMSTYNVGVLASQRVRLQTVADAAAYSGAVWQARFLNYCAYTRRAMIANTANMNLMAASKTNAEGIKNYYDQEYEVNPLVMFTNPFRFLSDAIEEFDWVPGVSEALDTVIDWINGLIGWKIDDDNTPYGMPRMSAMVVNPVYQYTVKPVQVPAISSGDHLNFLLGESQKAMYFYVSQPWFTTVHEIVDAANNDDSSIASIDNYTPLQIEVSPAYEIWGAGTWAAEATGLLNMSMLDQKELKDLEQDIKLRTDAFTRGRGYMFEGMVGGAGWFGDYLSYLAGNDDMFPFLLSLPFFASRPYWGFDLVWLAEYASSGWPAGEPKVIYIDIPADEVNTDFAEDKPSITAKDGNVHTFSMQYYGWVYIPLPYIEKLRIPIIIPFNGKPDLPEYTYDFAYESAEVNHYDLKSDLEPSQFEPSVYVALRIPRETLVGENEEGDGALFHNKFLPIAESTRSLYAVSRAKVLFQPRYQNRGREFYKPNMYYPYWEAQLAPFWGAGFNDSSTQDTIGENGDTLMTALLLEVLAEEAARGGQGSVASRTLEFGQAAMEIKY